MKGVNSYSLSKITVSVRSFEMLLCCSLQIKFYNSSNYKLSIAHSIFFNKNHELVSVTNKSSLNKVD
jgi:hypothetical protein